MARWSLSVIACLGLLVSLLMRKAPHHPGKASTQDSPAASSTVTASVADADDATPTATAVDLTALRGELPGNVYWAEAAPTEDPPTRARRLADKARRNLLYGKILSGTGSPDDIERYFADRDRSSRDYIAFAQHVLDRYGEQLTEEERGLYELAIAMHRKRLSESPGERRAAYARRDLQLEARLSAD